MKSTQIGKDKKETKFSELLEASLKNQTKVQPGTYEIVTVTDITNKDFVFVSSSRGNGLVHREEMLDGHGKIRVARGEKFPAFYASTENGEMVFTIVPSGRARSEILKNAMENKVPMSSRVLRKVKGGFELSLGDVTAFCPQSHMDGNPAPKDEITVLVLEVKGDRVIVSNRAFKDIEKQKTKEVMMQSLQPGDVMTGKVASLVDFGAFVDIGGIEGLVPLSEISYQKPTHASQALKSGQEVRVKVLQIDWKEDKLTLSIRALLDNPWQGQLPFKEGEILSGTVDAVKAFGVFVKLPGNFTGLIPASETGIPRGQSFEKHFHRGQQMRVMLQSIDRQREKISLSVKSVAAADQEAEYTEYMKENKEASEQVSSFGKQLMQSLEKQKSGD